MPFSLIYKLLSTSFGFFTYLFPFLPRLFTTPSSSRGNRSHNTTGRRPLNPRDTAARFKREFDELHGPNSLPFLESSYAASLDRAKSELKYLLIILTSPEHDDTLAFIHDTLLSQQVTDFINAPENNILLWAGSVQDSEAYQVSTALRCTKFPFTALISHTPAQGSAAMSVITRISGPVTSAPFIAQLQAAMAQYNTQLSTARAAREAQNFERSLRQEQDSAYERSLAQDRERVRLRKEAAARVAEKEREEKERAEMQERKAAQLEQWRRWRVTNIEPEPEVGDKDAVRIGLRMPGSAERVTRRFRGDVGIEEVYAFVECFSLMQDPEKVGVEREVEDGKPEGYEHVYGFRLVSPMPRTVYEVDGKGSVKERVGRAANLIVEVVDEEDGEGEVEE